MTDVVREQVLGYLLGALDDAEMEQVRARLESEESYRLEWIALRRLFGEREALRSAVRAAAGPGRADVLFRLFARQAVAAAGAAAGDQPAIDAARPVQPLPAVGHRRCAIAVFFLAGLLVLAGHSEQPLPRRA